MTPTVQAALWMSGAIFSFSLMAVAGREMALDLDTFEIMLYRSIIGVILVGGFVVATERLAQARTERFGLHVLRNVFHFTGQNLWFYALAIAPLAHVIALEFTVPIWVALIAPFVIGERLTRNRIVAIALGFIGILCVTRPGLEPIGAGQVAALLAALGFAGTYMTTKALSSTEPVWRILFWMTVIQTVFGLVCAGYDGDIAAPPRDQLGWIMAVGLGGLCAHLCLTSALRVAPALVVAPMDFFRLPVIAMLGAVLYDERLTPSLIIGAALIIAGNLANLRRQA